MLNGLRFRGVEKPNQAESYFYGLDVRAIGKESRRMLKQAAGEAAASEDRRRTLWGTLRI